MPKKNQFLVPQLKLKFAPSPSLHPMSDHIINTHTNQVKTLRMDCPGNTSIPLYRPKRTFDLKTVICLCWVIKKKLTHRHPNQPKLSPVQFTPRPYKIMYAFSHSLPGQGLMPTNLLPVIVPRMEPSYTHSH